MNDQLCNVDRALGVMADRQIDAFVAVRPHNVYYLTGYDSLGMWSFPRVAMAVLASDGQCRVVTADIDLGFVRRRPGDLPLSTYAAGEMLDARHTAALDGERAPSIVASGSPTGMAAAFVAVAHELGLRRIAIDDLETAERARALDGTIEMVPGEDLLRFVRMVKTASELALMRVAGAKNELATTVAMEAVANGATFGEATRVYARCMLDIGGEPEYLIGEITAPGHPPQGDRGMLVRPGDAAFFDAFGGWQHYRGDIGRTLIHSEPTADQLRAFTALRAGWDEAAAAIRPGIDSTSLAAVAIAAVRRAGGGAFGPISPHCVGLEHFDNPIPNTIYEPFVLEEGMTLNLDMPYVSESTGMFHTEDTVVVTHDGCELISSNDTRLRVAVDGAVVAID